MRIDPVVELAEELRAAELSLHSAAGRRRHGAVGDLLLEIGYLENRLALTRPTSALGAGEQLRLAAQYLQFADSRYAGYLAAIAKRMIEGKRELTDLVWLRSLVLALAHGTWGEKGATAAKLVSAAIEGAARPVLVYRSVAPPRGSLNVQSRAS